MSLSKLSQHLTRGEYIQAQREAERLVHTEDLDGAQRVQAYRGGALAHYYVQEIFAAAKLGEKALELATSLGNWELIGKARYDLGEFSFTLGDTHLAREILTQFLEDLDRYPQNHPLEAGAHHTLALIYRQRREYAQALASHHKAAELFRQQENLRKAMEAIRGIIWCHLTAENPSAAWPFIQEIVMYLQDSPDDALSASLLTDFAYYHRLTGDIKASMAFCEEALVPGRPGADDTVRATTCLLAGENALDLARLHEAALFGSLGVDYALKAKHPLLMNRASALRRRLHEMKQPPIHP